MANLRVVELEELDGEGLVGLLHLHVAPRPLALQGGHGHGGPSFKGSLERFAA